MWPSCLVALKNLNNTTTATARLEKVIGKDIYNRRSPAANRSQQTLSGVWSWSTLFAQAFLGHVTKRLMCVRIFRANIIIDLNEHTCYRLFLVANGNENDHNKLQVAHVLTATNLSHFWRKYWRRQWVTSQCMETDTIKRECTTNDNI